MSRARGTRPRAVWRSGGSVDCGLKDGRRGEGYQLMTLIPSRGCSANGATITDSVPGWRDYGRWTPAAEPS